VTRVQISVAICAAWLSDVRQKNAAMRYVLTIVLCALFAACGKEPRVTAAAAPATDYKSKLASAKGENPFVRWPFYARPFVNQIFDRLVADLAALGEDAAEEKKAACFSRAVASLNTLDATMPFLIETTEAEQLVGLGNSIAKAAGLDPRKYGDREGPLSAGRNW
jgi:hypothetical protein